MKGQLLVIIISRNGLIRQSERSRVPPDRKIAVRYADKSCMLSKGLTWAKVELRICDASGADFGSYYVGWQDEWSPTEAINGRWLVIYSSPTGGWLRASPPRCKYKVEKSEYGERRRDSSRFDITTASYSDRIGGPATPLAWLRRLTVRMIRFGIDKVAWQPQDIDAPGDTLCDFEHLLSRHSIGLGHVTVDPTRKAEAILSPASSGCEGTHRTKQALAGGSFAQNLLELGKPLGGRREIRWAYTLFTFNTPTSYQ